MDDGWDPEQEINLAYRAHLLHDGELFLQTWNHRVLVIDGFDSSTGEPPSHWILDVPGYKPTTPNDCLSSCLGELSGVLHYAQPDTDGRSILVWSHGGGGGGGARRSEGTLKHRLSMSDAFGRDAFLRLEVDGFWSCYYDMDCLDLDRDVVFLRDYPRRKLLSYSVSTGQLTEIRAGVRRYLYYVPHCGMFPAQDQDDHGD
uniref:DUF295 domain-containing protein n=1 Tax=Oryza brachyantha TaxID=4533 RepID=J3L041_ORYBR